MNNNFENKINRIKKTASELTHLVPARENDTIDHGPRTIRAPADGWFFKRKDSTTYSFWDKKEGDLSLAVLEKRIENNKDVLNDYLDNFAI